jgi:hypothetical protein
MEKVQKTPITVTEVGQPDQYGNKSFSIVFNDNTSGFFRCQNQNLFTVGQESEFYMGKVPGKSGKEYYKIERVEKHENNFDNNQKKSFGSSKSKDSEKFMCLSYAKDIFIAFNGKMPAPTEVTAYAEALYSETVNGVQEKDGHQKALETPKPVETDELPF